MDDFPHDDPILGPSIVSFDGHVVELFTERSGSVARLVAGMIFLQVDDPDRKGRREVWFTCGPNRRGGGFRLMFGEEQWAGFEPWLRQLAATLRERQP